MNNTTFSRSSFRRAALASVITLGTLGASNSFAADATTTSTATVIQPIAVLKSADLDFGRFAAGEGGTVTVSPDGLRSNSGTILSSIGSNPTAAQFDVTGDNDATYSIAWSGATVLTHTDTIETMALTLISDLTPSAVTTGEVTSGTLNASGTQSIYLGGQLAVGATQEPGDYSGDVDVAVEYN